MKQAFNFNAGPCVLPKQAIESTVKALYDFDNTGIGIAEISHRTPGWERIMAETRQLWRDLLNIPEEYEVLFLGGGASTQFFTVPANLMKTKAAYLQTGVWAKKAAKEAKLFGKVDIVASSEEKTYTYIPKGYTIPLDADYFHITTNNTIFGTEISDAKLAEIYRKKGNVPLVADMSSDILSRPIDVSQYDIIYGGAQKNLAPAGVTFVIIKESCLGRVSRYIPTMLNYQTHIEGGSMFNTPPVLPVYTALLTLRWLKANGGLKWIEARNKAKAELLYNCLDNSKLFTPTILNKEDRSRMNICFVFKPGYEDLQDDFFKFATERGMVGIKGHRLVGGFRASCYNAMDLEGVQALVDCIHEYEKLH